MPIPADSLNPLLRWTHVLFMQRFFDWENMREFFVNPPVYSGNDSKVDLDFEDQIYNSV